MCIKRFGVLFAILCISLSACGAAPETKVAPTPIIKALPTITGLPELPPAQIARHPDPVDFRWMDTPGIPKYDPNSDNTWQVDLRSDYLKNLDLSNSTYDLLYASFDSKTQWPDADKMPRDFDWQKIMEMGKNPGLGIRALHDKGITGLGVGIAIIDQTLLVDHVEYKDQIRVYEEAEDVTGGWKETQMHGPAVASIAVGKTVGVAPDADLYYIATGDCGGATSIEDYNFACDAKAVRRIIEINQSLPEGRKVRVLSMSIGWDPRNKGYAEIVAAVEAAKTAGIFVVSSSISETYGLYFHGLGRNPLVDPDQFSGYEPGMWWSKNFYANGMKQPRLLVPMDARTTASPTGVEDYVYYRTGGWSWSIPYLAGMYALAVQVKPDIIPEQFWRLALTTGQTIQVEHEGKTYSLGPILDSTALIAALQK